LDPGQAIFQGAGMPHAYLEGQNIELMSNSDNVLRAGLTPKHVDIPELLSNTAFVPTIPEIMKGELGIPNQVYKCPVNDFILYADCIQAGEERVIPFEAPGIFLVMEGSASWSTIHIALETDGVDSLFVSAGEELKVKANSKTSFFIATVPSTPIS
jgi:mannose-6-phosphate isomerase